MNKQKKRGNSEGSIYRMADGRWAAAITLEPGPDGKRRRKVYVGRTRHKVQEELTKALNDRQQGLPVITDKQTVAQFLKHWLEHVVKNTTRPKTHRTYSDIVKLHLTPGIGDVPIGKLSSQKVREFLNAKLAASLSPRTVKHILVTLRGALEVAVKDALIPRNVAGLVDPPRAPRPQVQAFSPDEARAFLDAVAGSRLEAVFTVAVALGMRQGEILGLKWQDIDLETGMLTVRAALQRVNKKLVQVEPKSAKGHRPIHLPATCLAALVRHKAKQEEEQRLAGSRWKETGYVFTTTIGTPLDARNLLKCYYRITRPKTKPGEEPIKLPFPAIRFHDLRHSTATVLLAQGVSPKYITELLGHSQVSFTMQTYAHVLPEVQKEVANKMDSILNPKLVANTVANNSTSESVN